MTQEELENEIKLIRERLEKYLSTSPYKFNPNQKKVELVLKGLATRKLKAGAAYCPCRLMSGNPEEDKKIICPCVYHKKEIEDDGICHCQLFVKKDSAIERE